MTALSFRRHAHLIASPLLYCLLRLLSPSLSLRKVASHISIAANAHACPRSALGSKPREDADEVSRREDLRRAVNDALPSTTPQRRAARDLTSSDGPTAAPVDALASSSTGRRPVGPLHQVGVLDIPSTTDDEHDGLAESVSSLACGAAASDEPRRRPGGPRVKEEVFVRLGEGLLACLGRVDERLDKTGESEVLLRWKEGFDTRDERLEAAGERDATVLHAVGDLREWPVS